MIEREDYGKVQVQLQSFLAERFDEVAVQIGDDVHYPGTNVVVTSPSFAGLLPEQRFSHVVRAIPLGFYEQYLRGGVVWFELAPGERAGDLMKMPRSEDIAEEEEDIFERLVAICFFEELQARFCAGPREASKDDFRLSREVLVGAGLEKGEVTRACLFFIRQGAYCDAQVLVDLVPKLAAEYAA